jgi:hypothetical protein
MNKFTLILTAFTLVGSGLLFPATAQNGCPGCSIRLPDSLPVDTIFLADAASGFKNRAYSEDISFRMPRTTTPVAAIDTTTPPGFPLSKITINSLGNLPAGITWELSKQEYLVDVETDGCVRLCGTPEETGLFMVQVHLTANVFGIQKDASFDFPLTIYPEPNDSLPFVLFGNVACGQAIVSFLNNVRSGGDPRFQYQWDFGNGITSTAENPAPVTYTQPGTYVVRYKATIDTAGYQLSQVKVTATTCNDFGIPPIISGNPDLVIVIENALRQEVYRSAEISNAALPAIFNLNLPIGQGSYFLRVWDKDEGLAGGDDFCGEIVFDQSSSGIFTQGNLSVDITMFHPLITIASTDTVRVYAEAPVPVVTPATLTLNCRDSLSLRSSVVQHVRWLRDGQFFSAEPVIFPTETGRYQVVFQDPVSGCRAASPEVSVLKSPPPPVPFFINNNNVLLVADTTGYPTAYTLQWFKNGSPLPREVDKDYCVKQSGTYGLKLTDARTGCSSYFEASIAWNPNFDCTVATGELAGAISGWRIFPNPATNILTFERTDGPTSQVEMTVFDIQGRMVERGVLDGQQFRLDVSGWPRGMYIFHLLSENGLTLRKVVKQ